jgi:Kef-type K+ transport system membrane component KefB
MTNFDLSVLFFLQLAVILAACRLVSALARRVGQPPVVSEMMAIATTLMATPLFELAYGRRGRQTGVVGAIRARQ